MRRRVFLAVLLALVLSLSKGENDTLNTSTPMTTATGTAGSSSNTSPAPNLTTTTETTGSTSGTDSTPPSPTTTEIPGSSSDTSPTPNLTTATETTGSSSDTSSTPNLMTTTETPGSPEILSDTSNTTISTDTTGDNNTLNISIPMTTATDTTGGNDTINTTTPMTTATDTAGENDTLNTTIPMTTATDTTGENDTINTTIPMTTATDTAGETDTITTTPPMTTGTTGDFCNPDPCGTNLATCVPLNSNYTCLCQYGFYYRNKDCHRAKIFPGVITLQETYDSSVLIVNSTQYEEMFENITQFFTNAFKNLTGFAQTVIVEIQVPPGSRAYGGINVTNVTVINLFMQNSSATNQTVDSAINSAIENSAFVRQYTGTTYCAVYNCDTNTTVCEEHEFPQCICQSNFSKTEWDTLSCSDCSKNCSETGNMYCAKENGVPICKCMPNFKRKDEKCVPCPVGYSGEECENNSELILIIVGTVFGAIILCLAIAVTVVSIRAKHNQDPEKKKLLRSGYSNPNTSDDRQPTMFPRVRTTTGHANPGYQPNNPYEMRDFDDLYEASREPEGFRMHNRN